MKNTMITMIKKLSFLLLIVITVGCGQELTLDQKIAKAHGEYAKRDMGYKSGFLPHVGPTRGDDYNNCIAQKYYRNLDSHDFCAWHAGIGRYQ